MPLDQDEYKFPDEVDEPKGKKGDDDDEDDDGDMKKLLVGMLPAILNRGGGGGGSGGEMPQLPAEMIDGMIEQAFQSPEVIQKIAMRNPHGIAKSFMLALKQNPALEKAVLEAVEKSNGDDED